VISFFVLIGLYVTLDMVFNFQELVMTNQAGPTGPTSVMSIVADIGSFYFYQAFFFFTQLSGVIPVVAAAFTLLRLSRFNELTALLAAGTPMLRMALPIIIAGVVLNVLLIVDQEWILPPMIPELERRHDEMHEDASVLSYPIQAMQDNTGSLLMVAQYTPGTRQTPPTMRIVNIIERDPATLNPVAHITAASATWNDDKQQWDLFNGLRARVLRGGEVSQQPPAPCPSYKSSISPEEIALYRGGEFVQYLPLQRIKQLLAEPKSYGTANLLRVENQRYTQPIANVVLLLLAIPAVLSRDPAGMKRAALKCLGLTALAMGTMFGAYMLAATPPALGPEMTGIWPALMAFLPLFIFFPLAVFLLDRTKT
jgi:lipopolysaccharide export LptBFGC system permease protein LptF